MLPNYAGHAGSCCDSVPDRERRHPRRQACRQSDDSNDYNEDFPVQASWFTFWIMAGNGISS
jgi:hypothetical protein